MNDIEIYLLKKKDNLCFMNSLLKKNQFNEIFLIKTRKYYNSNICLRTQKNLPLLFSLEYLYDSKYDCPTTKTYFDDLYLYYKDLYSKKYIINYYKFLLNNEYI